MQTTPVRLNDEVLKIVRTHKKVTGFPVGRFIEDAIVEKVERLPEGVQKKMGLIKSKK